MNNNTLQYLFIIPYRNREPHKVFFEQYMKIILEDFPPNSYALLFVHQKDTLPFNRGAMKNIGFLYAKQTYPNQYKNLIFIFNDVDTVPYKKNLIDYHVDFGEIKHFYGYTFALGGIFSIRGKDFEMLNGFPNFWGWGFEDNTIYKRAIQKKLKINRDKFFPILSMEILHFFDEVNKQMDKTTLTRQFNKQFNEDDGLSYIRDVDYSFQKNINMLDVKHFKSKYTHTGMIPYTHNLLNGNKIKNPASSRRPTMKMNFF